MEAGTLQRPETAAKGDGGDAPKGAESNLVNDQAPPVDELALTGSQLQFPSMGGKKPTGSTFKITGGKIDLGATSFKKGEVVEVVLTCVVNNVAQVDKHDPQTGIVVSSEQRHSARVTDIRIAGE